MALARRIWLVPAVVVAAPLIGAITLIQPALAVLVLGVVLLARAVEAPLAVLCLFALTHVSTPAYVRIPLPGGFYNPPISTAVMLTLFGIGLMRYLAGHRIPPVGPEVARPLTLFVVFAAVALVSLSDPSTTSEGVAMWAKVFLVPGLVITALLACATTPQDVARIFRFLTAGVVLASLFGVYEYLIGYNPLIDAFDSDIVYFRAEILGDTAYRAFSVYGNPIEYGTCVGMVAPYAMVRLATSTGWRERVVYGAVLAMCYVGIAVSFSRGPMLAMLIGTVLIASIYASLRRWLIGGAIVAAVMVAAVWPFVGTGVSDRLHDVDNVTLRFKLWETAAAIYKDHPVLGVGIGNFPQYYLQATRTHRIGPFYEFGEDSLETIRVAENTYLQLAAETGTIGIIAAMAFLLAILSLTLRLAVRARSPATRDLAIVCLTGMLIFAINGMFITGYTHFFATMLLIGFLFGFVLTLAAHDHRSATADVLA
jgi:O-antigen ligase